MAYSTSSPPARIVGTITGHNVWFYTSADDDATTNGAGYYTNGDALGMKAGDLVIVYDTTTPKTSVCYVSTVTAGGAATTAFAAVA